MKTLFLLFAVSASTTLLNACTSDGSASGQGSRVSMQLERIREECAAYYKNYPHNAQTDGRIAACINARKGRK